jgi:hypothetical protein
VHIEYAAGESRHVLHLRQRGHRVDGAHQGEFVTRDLHGSLDGEAVRLRSELTEDSGDALVFTFSGRVDGDNMSGALDMGQYLGARWTATRRSQAKA